MQKRKILFIGLIAIFAIVIIGSVSAFSVGSLIGDSGQDSEPQEITIEGIKFNVPDGYKEAKNSSFDNTTSSAGSLSYTMNGKTYQNSEGDAIAILVADYGDFNVTDDILKQVGDEKKTVNGHKGYIKKEGIITVFSYEEDGNLVTISASDDGIFDQVVV